MSHDADRSRDLRDDLWRSVGELGSHLDPVGEDTSALWPGGSAEYLQVRTEHTGIVTTDGLSDPGQDRPTGLGVEIYVEGRELAEAPLPVEARWLQGVLEEAVEAVAPDGAGLGAALERHGVLSLELSGAGAPADWVSGGRLGVLLGVPLPGRADSLTLDGGQVRLLTLVPLRPSELAVITAEGPAGRERVVAALAGSGWHSYVESARPAVL